jgi:hypothetical protein
VIDEGVVICSSALKVLSNVYRLAIKKLSQRALFTCVQEVTGSVIAEN